MYDSFRRSFVHRVDNVSVALLTLVNQLAESYGVEPWTFVAALHDDPQGTRLQFEMPPSDPAAQPRFDAMLLALGISEEDPGPQLVGTDEAIGRRLSDALRKAPRLHRR